MTILTTIIVSSLIIATVVGPSALTVYHCQKNRKTRKVDIGVQCGEGEDVCEFTVAASTAPTSSKDQQGSETSTLNTVLDTDSIETVNTSVTPSVVPFPAVEWDIEGSYVAWWGTSVPPRERPSKSLWWLQNPDYFWNLGLGV
ncbi:8347_t:CDS:2 [Ambispora gerdemannii]|uniref:8347_t:CDS:1 n=1 Tax=Ambispora gerdemannii TaxID=144530 RepID=A0A9N8V424_9GLOM|nr:8347_t:CDS:2 [Ambispora gerdemannii]